MKFISSFILSLFSVLGFSQTILYQAESTSRTVQDPQSVILTEGFYASSSSSNPFIAKIGPATENPGGGPVDSGAGANNPSGTTETTDNKFYDTKGDVDVTAAGQLQFSLPIALPPGVKSVAPQINLAYTSGSSNGIAGYGWTLSGITAISRVGKNIEKDGAVKGIQLDYSDLYSFNGQRLILKSGEYGKDGAEYVTEKYSNTKIKSVGNNLSISGPEYWEVTFEDGSQAWYGAVAPGNSNARTPLEYNIVKWKDIKGNYIIYNYTQIASTNVATISSIEWGGNETLGKTHFNIIEFNYFNERTFKEINYLSGIEFIQNRLLKEIVVKSNGNQFKRYAIEYADNGTSYQFAKKLTEFNAANESANPVIFNYEQNNTTEYTPYQSLSATNATKKYADFNLDGETDYIEFVSNGVLKYRSSLYKGVSDVILSYDPSKFTSGDFSRSTPVTFKKDNYIKNSIGLVIPVQKSTDITNKKDYEFQVYSVDITNQKLVFEYSKTITHDQYSPYSPDDEFEICNISAPAVGDILAYDYNGDGVSELIVKFRVTKRCNNGGDPTDPPLDINSSTDAMQTELQTPDESVNIVPGTTLTSYTSLIFLDLEEALISPQNIYKIESGLENPKVLFADLNGDGVQEIITMTNSQFSKVFNIKRDGNFNYSTATIGNFTGQNFVGQMYTNMFFADFNGDNKADILIPVSNNTNQWKLYISDGKSFITSTVALAPFQTNATVYFQDSHSGFLGNSCDRVKLGYFNYDVNDIDGDGKSEFIVTEVQYEEHEWDAHNDQENTLSQVSVYSLNKIDNYSIYQGTDTSSKYTFYKTRVWTNNYPQKAIVFNQITMSNTHQQLILLGKLANCSGCTENYAQYYNHPSLTTLSRIQSIEQGGTILNVIYKELNPDINPDLYLPIKKEEYPYYESSKLPKSFAVAQLNKMISPGKVLYQDFRYRGFLNHNTGKGFIGYRQMARSSWYSDGFENTKIWSGTEIDPTIDGLPVKEWSIRTNDESKIFPADISENNTQLLSFKSIVYQADKLINGTVVTTVAVDDKPKVVTAIVPKNTKSKDFLTGILTTGSVTYGDYYLPNQSIFNVNNGYGITTSTFEYINNPSGIGTDYYIGRPKTKTDAVQAYGDTKSAKEEYTYENNLLKTLKTWNRDNTGYLQETYNYDGFGNITNKTISNSIDSQTQTTTSDYDPKGRFVIKKIDNLGLETNIEYNDWGQIKKQIDPLGNTLINTYDNWGKLLTSKSNLEGTTTYQYEKDSQSNIIVTQNDPDGDISKKFTNRFGQEYKTSTKAFEQGQFVSQNIRYDVLGRKIMESEPYFEGQNPSLWNGITYDDTIFPAKIASVSLVNSFNSEYVIQGFIGKKVETTISGLTTTVKEINGYARSTSKTADALGNVLSSTDKGGTIQFSYNAAGEQIKAQYAENIVTTKYDSWGRKSEFNDPSNGIYKYEYDGFGQPKKIISPKGTKEYTYNNLGQLISQKEISTADGGEATNKLISFIYDDKGRLISKGGTSKGQAYSSTISYDLQGRVLSSSESSNGKYFIQKGITYDDKGRIISYEKQLYSSGVLTKVQIENLYSTWNGELYLVKDKVTGKALWELKETNAKGQVLKTKLGAVDINNAYDSYGFLTSISHINQNNTIVLQMNYTFDAIKNELKTRTRGGDFNITEIFNYDDSNRLINWTNPATGQMSHNNYDIKGRITENDQVGTMKYENASKIYQPSGMTLNVAGEQNYNSNLIQNIVYNENNDPVFIDGEKGDAAFQYGLTSMRQRVTYGGNFSVDGDGKFTKFYSEDGSFEVVKDNTTGKEKHILYIGGTPYESNIVYLKDYTESSGSYKFLHKDYIGSVLAISDEAGNRLEQRHFDAWGNFTHLQIGNGAIITDKNIINNSSLLADRGYTSHEHFAEVGIIHMNGRLYDPLLRRFLNADENIQEPFNTQNYNKYGYVMNNPLMFNDPNGEFFQFLGLGVLFWKAVIIGAYIGFTSYMITAAITNQGVSLAGGLKAIFFGAASGAVTFGVGSIFSSTAGAATQFAKSLGDAAFVVKAVAHGVAQGALSLMQNNSFQQSFFSGFFGSIGASAFGAIAGNTANSVVGTVAFGAVAGGVGAELSGGNFWQGALIGGVVAGLNHTLHNIDPPNEYMLNKDGSTTKIGDKGGDKTDYLYEPESTGSPKLRLIATANVQNGVSTASAGGGKRDFGINIKLDTRLQSPALYDPSFDIAVSEIGGGAIFKGIRVLSKGKFMFEKLVYRPGGQTTFSIKWMNQSKNYMFRFERHNIPSPKIGYRTHINLNNLSTKTNAHIYLNPKYWKHTTFK
ncbi:RHS repeat-associated core domain-containing protein [Chryseobacterium sp. MIQD13]|uniref:RHS repeat-associated core domain-containing protein n=1 Tax=Chryseobacterium sp. MIQD13 TaxID=3422310 RepID=UPI003D2E0373